MANNRLYLRCTVCFLENTPDLIGSEKWKYAHVSIAKYYPGSWGMTLNNLNDFFNRHEHDNDMWAESHVFKVVYEI